MLHVQHLCQLDLLQVQSFNKHVLNLLLNLAIFIDGKISWQAPLPLFADEHVATIEEDIVLERLLGDVLLQELRLTLPEHGVGVSLSMLTSQLLEATLGVLPGQPADPVQASLPRAATRETDT